MKAELVTHKLSQNTITQFVLVINYSVSPAKSFLVAVIIATKYYFFKSQNTFNWRHRIVWEIG